MSPPLSIPPGALVLDHIRVVDGDDIAEDQAVVLLGEWIYALRPGGVDPAPGRRVLDLRGRTVVPGLIDSHTHLFHSGAFSPVGSTLGANLQAQLAWGVLGVADVGAPAAIFDLRDEIAAGLRLGPRIWATGPMLTTEGSHPCEVHLDDQLCHFVDGDGAARVAELARADGLKVVLADAAFTPWPTPRLDLADLAEITAAAAAAGQPVVAHVDSLLDAQDADALGVNVLGHPVFAEVAGGGSLPLLPVHSTLSAFAGPRLLMEGGLLEADLRHTPEAVQQDWRQRREEPEVFLPGWLEESAAWEAAARANLRAQIQAGGAVLPGSDAGYWLVPHGLGLHQELEGLVALGLSPQDALRAATLDAAEALGWSDLGRVRAGWRANLLVVEGDPTIDVGALRQLHLILLDGRVLDPSSAGGRGPSTQPDAVCIGPGDCGEDAACDAFTQRCVPACEAAFDPLSDCGADAVCLPADGLPDGPPACRSLQVCDPYDQDCEPQRYGLACVPLDLDTSACLPAGGAALNQSCSVDADAGCRPGLYCSPVTARCLALCDPNGPETCPEGACQLQRFAGQDWFGLCL